MPTAQRVALFGLFGSGNVGNHGSLDAMLEFLRTHHPDAQLMCVGADPDEVETQFGIPSLAMNWYFRHNAGHRRIATVALKSFGKVADFFRTLTWVRRFDVVIVPGMGILEATLPIRPWGIPYALFTVSMWARLCGAKVALVSVGASEIRQPATRWFLTRAAKLAHYRSFRDVPGREAMRRQGVNTHHDPVFPDLAFALPIPERHPTKEDEPGKTVGVGVMAYSGTYLDRKQADLIYNTYVAKLIAFVRWLVGNDYQVRLFTGDPSDEAVAAEVLADLRRHWPDRAASCVIAERGASLRDLMEQMSAVDTVVASRYHNVLSGLMLGKPTISISYASKNDVLMDDMGLAEFCQPIRSFDVLRLIDQFHAIEDNRDGIAAALRQRTAHKAELLAQQNALLSAALFDRATRPQTPATAGSE